MAATVTKTEVFGIGPGLKIIKGTVTLDSEYLTGGEEVDLSSLTPTIHMAMTTMSAGYWFEMLDTNFASGKFNLKAFQQRASTGGAALEVPSSTDLSAVVVPYIALCSHGLSQ